MTTAINARDRIDDPARPPTDAEAALAIDAFANAVRARFGDRVHAIYLFGSRARGDHAPHSDADMAVVLADDEWDFWDLKLKLADLSYAPLVDFGIWVQGWPVPASAWNAPETHRNPWLIRAMRRDGKVIRHVT